jgi:hypothetical protein
MYRPASVTIGVTRVTLRYVEGPLHDANGKATREGNCCRIVIEEGLPAVDKNTCVTKLIHEICRGKTTCSVARSPNHPVEISNAAQKRDKEREKLHQQNTARQRHTQPAAPPANNQAPTNHTSKNNTPPIGLAQVARYNRLQSGRVHPDLRNPERHQERAEERRKDRRRRG